MKNRKKQAGRLLYILLGDTLYSLSVQLFLRPGGLLTGGTTGISLAVEKMTGFPAATFMLLFNSLLFLLALWLLGREFALSTLLSTFLCPATLALFEKLLDGVVLTRDPMLCAVFGGLGLGAGMGLVIRAGASTGGMDIPSFLLLKYFRVPIAVSIYAFDVAILLLQAVYSDTERILYGILLVFLYTIVLDKVQVLGHGRIEVKIVSERAADIQEAILSRMDRGVTVLEARGGLSGKRSSVLLSVLSKRELPVLEEAVHAIDPQCFMVVSPVAQVSGRGFSLDKRPEVRGAADSSEQG